MEYEPFMHPLVGEKCTLLNIGEKRGLYVYFKFP